jgi:hypothetical protein
MTRIEMQVVMFATTKEKMKPEALALQVELWLNSQSLICMGEEEVEPQEDFALRAHVKEVQPIPFEYEGE